MRKRAKQFAAGTFSAPARKPSGPRQADAVSTFSRNASGGRHTLQSATFERATPCKGSKPKLWGFYNPKRATPGVCIIRNSAGRTLRVER